MGVGAAQRSFATGPPRKNFPSAVFVNTVKTFCLERSKMQVGDLVTLSAAGKGIRRVADEHKRFFRGTASSYYGLCADDLDRFLDYWQNDRVVGLVTAVVESAGRYQYDWDKKQYISTKSMNYHIAWQANPKALATTKHSRGHLKFVKKHKGK